MHRYFIQDLDVCETEKYHPNSGIEIYEVVRVEQGIPLFLEDHLARFFHSAWLCHLEIPIDGPTISVLLTQLIDSNDVVEGNIRFSYCFRPMGNFQAYFIPHFWPGRQMVYDGAACGILEAERVDPNAKVVQQTLRDNANKLMVEKGYYEVLLVNKDGNITEGSRSNVFFLKDDIFFTAPESEVLPGITRRKVMDLIVRLDFRMEEKSYPLRLLDGTEGVILTGTSPKVLPVRMVGGHQFKVEHEKITQLITAYDQLILDYILSKKCVNPV